MPAQERPPISVEQVQRLAELYASQGDRMRRMAARALPANSLVNAEDVVQTVFVEAIAASSKGQWVLIGEGWLIQRLRARILDQHRRLGRQQRRPAAAPVEPMASAEELAIDGAAVDELLAAIPDPRDRLALAFKLYGYREAEIARLLSVPYAGRQVRDRLRRVRRQVETWRSGAFARESGAPGRT
jgi:DNA-directed RNA polymerase specialized sigma24 family protein